jgi:ankyrin repeat protein
MVKLLHEMGADINEQDLAYSGATPFLLSSRCDRLACTCGRCKVQIMEYLIRRVANLLLVDSHGRFPLHYASQSGCEAIVKLCCAHVPNTR